MMKATCSQQELVRITRALYSVTLRCAQPHSGLVRVLADGDCMCYRLWADGVDLEGSLPAKVVEPGTTCYMIRPLHRAVAASHHKEVGLGATGLITPWSISVPTTSEDTVPVAQPKPPPAVFMPREAFTKAIQCLKPLRPDGRLHNSRLQIADVITLLSTDGKQSVRFQLPRATAGVEATLWVPPGEIGLLSPLCGLFDGKEVEVGWSDTRVGFYTPSLQACLSRADRGPAYDTVLRLEAKVTRVVIEAAVLIDALRVHKEPTQICVQTDLRLISPQAETVAAGTVEIADRTSFVCNPGSLLAGAKLMAGETIQMAFDDKKCMLTCGPLTFYSAVVV